MRRIWAFVAINVGLMIQAAMVTLKMNENTPRGKEIAQLRSSLDQSAIESNTELEFRIVRQDRQNGLELFDIDGTQGRLIVKQSPDREILCPDPLAQCLLKLQVNLDILFVTISAKGLAPKMWFTRYVLVHILRCR